MTLPYLFLVAHVLFTTAGYVGLIGANVSLLFLSRSRSVPVVQAGLTAWRKSSRIFGPILATGVLLGFVVASMLHEALNGFWLSASYVVVVIAVALQAAVMVPWQLRSDRLLTDGAMPPMGAVALVLTSLCVAYTALLGLMLVRPA